MKWFPLYSVSILAAFTIGLLQQIMQGVLGGEDISAQTATLVVAAPCTVLLHFGFRWSTVPIHLGQVLSSYRISMATAASVVVSYSAPRLIFQGEGAVGVSVTLLVAGVIAVVVGAALAKFYRGSTPESPEDLH